MSYCAFSIRNVLLEIYLTLSSRHQDHLVTTRLTNTTIDRGPLDKWKLFLKLELYHVQNLISNLAIRKLDHLILSRTQTQKMWSMEYQMQSRTYKIAFLFFRLNKEVRILSQRPFQLCETTRSPANHSSNGHAPYTKFANQYGIKITEAANMWIYIYVCRKFIHCHDYDSQYSPNHVLGQI